MGTLDDSPAMQITGTIMVIAIIVLFLVVVFVLFLHLYARWFWWSLEDPPLPPPASRRRRRRRFVFTPTQDSVRGGLDLALLRSLPVVIFRSEDFLDGLECAVCLSELETGEKASLLPTCNHGFHVDCIDMWFQSHSTCPLCRNSVAPLPQCSPPNSNEDPGHNIHSSYEIGATTESPNFPTNVLIWGDQNQVSAGGERVGEGGESNSNQCPPPPSSSSSGSTGQDEMLIIEIPEESGESVVVGEEESKSPVPTRLRSLKRLLSRERRVAPGTSDEV